MTRSLYYRTVYRKKNSIIDAITGFFQFLAFFPRIVLEVFIRKNFGERYFKLTYPIVILFLQIIMPISIASIGNRFGRVSFWDVVTDYHHITYYLFMIAFGYFSVIRKLEIKASRNKYDFQKFSLYDGDSWDFLKQFARRTEFIDGKPIEKTDGRKLETIIEPGFFLLIGIILLIIGQSLGLLLIVYSIIYSLSYVAAWRSGDDYILDIIDEMISVRNNQKSFVEGLDADQTDGYKMRGHRPTDPEFRRKVADEMIIEDDDNPTFAL